MKSSRKLRRWTNSIWPLSSKVVLLAAGALLSFLLLSSSLALKVSAQDTDADTKFWQSELQPFLMNYCFDCHSGSGAEADIDFSAYESAEALNEQRPKWNQIRGMIEIGAMPPADYDPLPSLEDRERIADWIDGKINNVDCQLVNDPGRVTMRRLNNVEYDNTIRDLLKVDFSPTTMIGFPSDGVGNGFDNQGDVLTLSPLQMEKYMQAAELIADRCIVQDPEKFRERRSDFDALFPTEKSTVAFEFADGSYEVKVRMEYGENDGEEVPVALLVDGQEIERWNVDGRKQTYRTRHEFSAGEHELTLHFVEDPHTESSNDNDRRILTDYMSLTGPEDATPLLPISHRNLVIAEPSDEVSVRDAAEQIFRPLLRRAFRREPTELDVKRVVDLVELASNEGESFTKSISYGLQSVLVSPHFLFRVEDHPAFAVRPDQVVPSQADATVAVEPLDDFSLASRLSYFLWSSMPDDELLDLAVAGKLQDPETLEAQAVRMLNDPRSEALVTRFFGQFLGLGNLNAVDPNTRQFPLWNDRMRDAMLRETQMFCREIVQQDLPLGTLLDGDFTFVNPRLAELYGMDFDGTPPKELYFKADEDRRRRRSRSRNSEYDREDDWIRVRTPPERRGVLSHASVLTLTSNPTSTSPVKRGKWILESILGDPPPPAPPNVPTLEATQEEHSDLSLREQLELHRSNPSCASCHNVMDPLGLGFENFDAIGAWREKDGKHPINAAGQLADGREFNGAVELVGLMESRLPEISKHFADKLLTYALGRGLEPYDYCSVEEILTTAREKDFRISAFVRGVVTSEPFSKRRLQTEK